MSSPRGRLRRAAVGLAVVLAAGTAGAGTGALVGAAPAPAPPDVVMIVLDDLDARATPYWEAMPKTRALLADRGLAFTEAFAPTPICCPARSTILTGKYGHNTGVLTNAGDQGGWDTFVANGNEERTVATALQGAGYRTGLAGKYLNGIEDEPGHIPPGWSEWYGAVDNASYAGYDYTLNENGTLVGYGSEPEDYLTDVLARKSVDFVERAAADGVPFLWTVTPTAPHYPMPAPPRYADNPFADDAAPRLPNYQERDVTDKPTWLQETARERSATVAAVLDRDHRNRMGSLLAVDDMVASIVGALERTGRLDSAYLVFVSDNGYNMGAHRLWQKMAPYEESLRVPLVVAGPGVRRGTDDRMVVLADLMPTILELAGRPVPADVDGRSLVPLLTGAAAGDWRTDFPAEYVGGGLADQDGVATELAGVQAGSRIDVPSWRALRTRTELYVEWRDGTGDRELYDLATDPYQLDNLLATPAGRAANAALTRRLAARLDVLGACSGAGCRS